MRIYLSSFFEEPALFPKTENAEKEYIELIEGAHILASFAYHKDEHEKYYPYCKSLLVDSGAFTFMVKSIRKGITNFDIKGYCKKYAEFVRRCNIDKFIELDVEGAYGFDVYRDCLHMLQDITGRDPIYVFHRWRGMDYFKELIKQKDYIMLGDVDVGSHSKAQEQFFSWFVEEAHKNNCKVHGLAFTQIEKLRYIPFDSVDSSSWTAGARFASLSRFDGHNLQKYDCKRTNERELAHNSLVKRHDYLEWKKLQHYFDTEMEPIW